jgi:exopolyphosphatase/guanosine-5'-triphosphate,3'-diphosphate pyrophosphatase
MHTAIIDCGTNTFNLLIAEVTKTQWTPVFSNRLSVRLGQGGLAQGRIRDERLARGVDALLTHAQTMLNFNVERAAVFATSAVREAINSGDFVKLAKKIARLDVTVIDGLREAELIYLGVKQTLAQNNQRVLIIDIGGGSTEFIIADHSKVYWKQSFPLGIARIFEYLQPSDVMTDEEQARLQTSFAHVLTPLENALNEHPTEHLVGASGTFDTLVAVLCAQRSMNPNLLSNEIELEAFYGLHKKLLKLPFEDRIALPGMLPMRADTIPLATSLIAFVLSKFGFTQLTQSAYALKEGAMAQLINGELTTFDFAGRHRFTV